MKKWGWIIGLLWSLLSCSREQELPVSSAIPSPEGELVSISFSVEGPEEDPSTKVLDNGGDIEELWVAVFGSSGYLKDYRKATKKNTVGVKEYTVEKIVELPNGGTETKTITHYIPLYNYEVKIPITDSPRRIHFLGNGPSYLPFGYDTAVMPIQMSQLSESGMGEKAYWQMIDLPNGIRAQRNEAGYYVDKDGKQYGIDSDFGEFILEEAQRPLFQEIPLIRNWAKIVLYADENANFTPHSFAIINYPKRGAIAPYSAATGFVRDYQTLDFLELKEMGYPANLPAGTEFDDSKPSVAEFQTTSFSDGNRVACATTKAAVDNGTSPDGSAVYLYERPAPSEKIPPSYVIVYGEYGGDKDGAYAGNNYFYKVDLMETTKVPDSDDYESSYYPIYRNFMYQILIKSIKSKGQDTPEAAAVSAGSADVSADITTSHLSDISNGIGRLHLTWMAQTFIKEHDAEDNDLQVFFSQDGEPDLEYDHVQVKILPMSDGGEDIILRALDNQGNEKNWLDEPFDDDTKETYGWRVIRFRTAPPGKTIRSQTMRITGYHDGGRLYRDIVISVQPKQPMSIRCSHPKISAEKYAEQAVLIGIPDGLPRSMFPLDFTIEAEKLSLSPDNSKKNNNLPVVYGPSLSGKLDAAGNPVQAFQFVRTLSWDNYGECATFEDENEKLWRVDTCFFKTNCANNASTVWVQNEYFYTNSTEFSNYALRSIHDYYIDSEIPEEEDVSLPFTFTIEAMDDSGNYPQITMRARGLINDQGKNGSLVKPTNNQDEYVFTPTHSSNTLYFITTTAEADFYLEMAAPGYSTVRIKPYRFESYGFLTGYNKRVGGSNVAFGRVNNAGDKLVIFYYYDNPERRNTPISLRFVNGLKIKGQSTNFPAFPGEGKEWTPTGPKNSDVNMYYHELELGSVKGNNAASMILSSKGYVTLNVKTDRYPSTSNMRSIDDGFVPAKSINKTTLSANFKYNSEIECTVTFSEVSDFSKDSYLDFNGASSGDDELKTYTITIENTKPDKMDLMYARLVFNTSFMPQSITADSGMIFKYGGAPGEYLWNATERGIQHLVITITPAVGGTVRLTNMSIKALEGPLDP